MWAPTTAICRRSSRGEVHVVHFRGSAFAQGLELVLAFEGLDGAVLETAHDDIARDRPDLGTRIGSLDELADSGRPLGDPGAAVEELRRLAKGCVVERH